jgi:glycosyltransferase involved in cell wall biosynthesis
MSETVQAPSIIPVLSVVLPVRDALPYLEDAIRSIVNQTWTDFEFVICDDGSTDGSGVVIDAWAARDPRIRVCRRSASFGPADSANWAASEAKAPRVARMDADDIAHPDRLRAQMQALDDHPDTVLVGTLWEGIDHQGKRVRARDRASLSSSTFRAPFAHGSILFLKKAFDAAGGYRQACVFWEDLDLYRRLACQGRLMILPDALYRHRFARTSTRLVSQQRQVEDAVDRMYRCRDACHAGHDYESLLSEPAPAKIDPRVFWAMGALRLWAGLSPAGIAHMLRRARLAGSGDAMVLIAVVLSSLWPPATRTAQRLALFLRNSFAATAWQDGVACEWGWSAAQAARADPSNVHPLQAGKFGNDRPPVDMPPPG